MPPGEATHGLRLGPVFETARAADGSRLLAIRPFYSFEATSPLPDGQTVFDQRGPGTAEAPAAAPQGARSEHDILWPLAIRSKRDDHSYWRALLLYGTETLDDPTSPNDPWRFRLFPIFFTGRTQEGEDYTALFPFGGTIRDFLVFHDTSFVLFPIYASGRSSNGTEMRTVLWPFYLTRHGERTDQFRLWPFYGTAERRNAATTRRSRFVAWPFWSDASATGQVEGSGFILFPIYGHSRYERQHRGTEESWSVIPPLFYYARGDDGYRKLLAPWPFVRILDTDTRHERHIWPLWGSTESFDGVNWRNRNRALSPAYSRQYFLWPFFSATRSERGGASERVLHLPMPFYFHRETQHGGPRQQDAALAPRASYSRLWPLFSYRRTASSPDGDAAETRFRVPELSLWSKSEQVERNWAPLWSLYTYRRKPDGAYCNDLLWGFLSWGRNSSGGRILSLLWLPLLK